MQFGNKRFALLYCDNKGYTSGFFFFFCNYILSCMWPRDQSLFIWFLFGQICPPLMVWKCLICIKRYGASKLICCLQFPPAAGSPVTENVCNFSPLLNRVSKIPLGCGPKSRCNWFGPVFATSMSWPNFLVTKNQSETGQVSNQFGAVQIILVWPVFLIFHALDVCVCASELKINRSEADVKKKTQVETRSKLVIKLLQSRF